MATVTEPDIIPDEDGANVRPERPVAARNWRWGITVLLIVGAVWSFSGLDASLGDVVRAPGKGWDIVRQMWPPDFRTVYDRGAVGKIFESLYVAWIGTIIGALLSFPLSFLAATNVAPIAVRVPIRQLFNAIRAVPELIVAMLLLTVTGLGPWAGALAIGLHSIGTLGKLSTEVIETSDEGPLEAISAAGGQWVSKMRWGMIPQVLPTVIGYWLFRFEINVRASAVLGLIGAGGIGGELVSQLNFRNFPETGAVLIMVIAMVLIIDTISGFARRRIIAGSGRPSEDDESANLELLRDLGGSSVPR
ncbi:MAG: phosphonate ABC transporter, permease protein PhnE [Ilumatobacter sp.]|uniref:phosphonate ABC transporter, permease protein PhnE n=1 Tax=Ilumatobacter sp. TaxID=1967498 RepID=UPI002620DE2E|nr:phosphonate ABC transporter, permease protein PhnE [Ilumatobacter sp.]MDJ0769084.1 phosphonate ABC transporter, permease protein PhnE [Ilumatobacter sp.]